MDKDCLLTKIRAIYLELLNLKVEDYELFLNVKGERLLIEAEQYFVSIYGRILDTYPAVLKISKKEWIAPDVLELTIFEDKIFGDFNWVQNMEICNALKDSEIKCIPKVEFDDIVCWMRKYYLKLNEFVLPRSIFENTV